MMVRRALSLSAVCLISILGCVEPGARPSPSVEVWAHAGQEAERTVLEDQAQRFNAMQDSVVVELSFLPEGSYNAQVQASAVAGRLPDLLDLDGPYVAQYAWQRHLRPLGGLMSDAVLAAVLPSILEQGTWRDELYAVGTFDSGLGLYARRSTLEEVGARLPRSPSEAWTVAELDELLDRLAGTDGDGAVLDLKLNYEGEWFTYAFQPALSSAGGGLLRTEGGRPAADGILNSRASGRALAAIQAWIRRGLVDPNLDDAAFVSGRVALSWSGHWDFPRYREALGSDLVILPLPDFGEGARTGQGSWMWTVPAQASHPSAAVAFLAFLLRPEEVLAMTAANGAVPGTRTAAERSERYGPEGTLRILLRQLEEGWAVPRPRTPAYPFASSVFQDVFEALRSGEALGSVLDDAAKAIDLEIEDNRGYPGT